MGVSLQIHEIDELECGFVGGFQHDLRSGPGFEGFLPAGGAEAPLVAGIQAGEAEFRARGAEVVAA